MKKVYVNCVNQVSIFIKYKLKHSPHILNCNETIFFFTLQFLISFSDEPGVFIGKIIPNNPFRAYLGYVDQKASEKKIVYDVFTKGDSAFISGINLF